ncbi:hypothetical protein M408DRAFT_329937 [Serendipita vermifera MAFF 305830]|uniref:RRM domain-containing protein n=1 Tax=Serendipita vermifera MAFF 305830 TaxID=933852 RepID=A0A0C2WMH7_SERVB|nr:hypothetical protein M408DRAFT_329937 [Serendipita vermifera MAFF 305830]
MAPKKQQKMSLNEFLGDATFGSWADEMEDLPTAPALKAGGEDRGGSALSRAPDRGDRNYPPREELPLPTQPPYTAFVGNLPFDITDTELGDHFKPNEVKSAKIIRDREDKPKGFGYVEFTTVDGLKNALTMTMSQLAGRSIRVSVADAPKEREGRGGFGDRGGGSSGFDEDRQWRREGPLPTHDDRRGGGGSGGGFGRSSTSSRFDDADSGERGGFGSKFQPSGGGREREPLPPSIAEETNDWRSNMRAPAPPPPQERGPRFGSGFAGGGGGGGGGPGGDNMRRRGSGINTPTGAESRSPKVGPADLEEKWTIGSRFKPSVPASPERASADGPSAPPFTKKFGNGRPGEAKAGEGEGAGEDPADWRSAPRKTVAAPPPATGFGRGGGSIERTPSVSGPPARRKLDLLPRGQAGGDSSTPIGSPKSGENTPASATSTKPNPFGAAKPVDAAAREREITEKMERTKLTSSTAARGSRPPSRSGSRQGSRAGSPTPRSPPKGTALGLGGMGQSGPNSPAPGTPKILARPTGVPPAGRHNRAPSATMSPKRGGDDGDRGVWRRDTSNASTAPAAAASSNNTNAANAPASPVAPPERRASTIRPSFSFANAAGGKKGSGASTPPIKGSKDETATAE